MGENNYSFKKKIKDRVWLYEYKPFKGTKDLIELRHECENDGWTGLMTLRDNEEGPVYWCCNCGYTLGNGEAMAVRLYEVNI